ncbi:PREDICTED: uncharacterized protein LOC106817257 [Priapulus caudatus]|uniref:Uncharacterized protein LOC106817257 n=1 Tax=Priapulus caudatus TaxID=37621 RepID=A0ABM1EYY1_PRICU|nr:PREDICTED: uncharacterized protein LOC106817257 [Priapulus caudatus]
MEAESSKIANAGYQFKTAIVPHEKSQQVTTKVTQEGATTLTETVTTTVTQATVLIQGGDGGGDGSGAAKRMKMEEGTEEEFERLSNELTDWLDNMEERSYWGHTEGRRRGHRTDLGCGPSIASTQNRFDVLRRGDGEQRPPPGRSVRPLADS